MDLVIVESPTKARTISRMLPGNFVVASSYGHVRDLPKSKMGVDLKENFNPTYVIPEKSKKVVSELKEKAAKASRLILATDTDREGEAIAWHLIKALGLDEVKNPRLPDGQEKLKIKKIDRIVFHEITQQAIEEALKAPRDIDMNLVDAQQARRILDRLVGYELSPFLWKKIAYGLSAGRVQSVALRLIVEREREIEAFKPEEYWTIVAKLLKIKNQKSKIKEDEAFEAALVKIDGEVIPQLGIKIKEEAEKIVVDLRNADFQVADVTKKETKRRPSPPFTTSTLQQTAWQRLRFSAKQTMRIAQQLYEEGYITYMRTDSTNLSTDSVVKAKLFLEENLGKEYALASARFFKTKSKLAQEAHEAIRPTDPGRAPDVIKDKLDRAQFRLYDLIWRRFVASQMPEALLAETRVEIGAKSETQTYGLRALGQKIIFDGFLKVWPTKINEVVLPDLKTGDRLELLQILPSEHHTEPLPRYNDASLVKALEEYGIGRPSTYAPTIATIETRQYIERDEKRHLQPTAIGKAVNDLLVKHFPEIVDYGFTAKVEEELDDIAEGKRKWVPVVKEFYGPFHKNLLEKEKEVTRREATERPAEDGEVCDKCGRPMVRKIGRYGEFLACSGYPSCKNIKKIPKPTLGIKCPKCDQGEVVMRRTKAKHRIFYGCSRWPECDFASWKKPSTT